MILFFFKSKVEYETCKFSEFIASHKENYGVGKFDIKWWLLSEKMSVADSARTPISLVVSVFHVSVSSFIFYFFTLMNFGVLSFLII